MYKFTPEPLNMNIGARPAAREKADVCHTLVTDRFYGDGDGDSFFLACEDLGRMFDNSFPA